MLILFNTYGNHSNRLIQNARFEAFCIENNIEFDNPTFSDLSDYYISPVSSKNIMVARVLKIKPIKYFLKYIKIIRIISFDDNKSDGKILTQCSSKKCYVEGWHFQTHGLNEKYQDIIAKKYRLKEEYYKNNPLYLQLIQVDRNDTALIGVHIRRGDYKTWKNGKYYFSDDVYRAFMENITEQVLQKYGKRCNFIIFSNEKTTFVQSEDTSISDFEWYVDHFLMSQCDFLIGPPSTFTLWSSYLGKAKYLHLEDPEMEIDIDKFENWKADV